MLLLFFGFVFILFRYEYTRIVRYGGGRREVFAFVAFMSLGVALGAAIILGWPIPNPADAVLAIFGPVGQLLMPSL